MFQLTVLHLHATTNYRLISNMCNKYLGHLKPRMSSSFLHKMRNIKTRMAWRSGIYRCIFLDEL